MLLSRKRLYRIKKTKQQSRKRRKRRNKKKYKKRKRAGSRRKRRALNLRKRTMKSYKGGYNKQNLSFVIPYFNAVLASIISALKIIFKAIPLPHN